ncbi:MAG: hypothetical protein COT25_04700 [Candidatus Kerfeldbacteria bacterium CG08_land_8_20_14_0_20_42_7]|uniref:Uncharacterized protein n=1 Tax=Candidatus Kerfeldbacteria bacterium CG08_land_8_20_14_0_20_42_7 TaxID=2014245 RepID=A0A2H0YRL5_9BACT|nr:MAG: hypothetical protein COT25_04700 [Candidatus Kerfeldbacteria bacterium CG08_land_8_20_14_0_20_42_7]
MALESVASFCLSSFSFGLTPQLRIFVYLSGVSLTDQAVRFIADNIITCLEYSRPDTLAQIDFFVKG